ncbi:MAG: hypothetical protein WD021_02030 [Rhodothermales bacterium]
MATRTLHLIFLDDVHAADVLFMQNLSRSMGRRSWRPAPVLVHGSGEHAEQLLESHGIFRSRSDGVLAIESSREHALVQQALRGLNQKVVALLTDAVVSSVGVMGSQRSVFAARNGGLFVQEISWLKDLCEQGVVPVVAASGRDVASGSTGEIPAVHAAIVLARALRTWYERVEVVFFTTTNLPGIMHAGKPREQVSVGDEVLRDKVPDMDALLEVVSAGLPVVLTNSNRLSDEAGPSGTMITAPEAASGMDA